MKKIFLLMFVLLISSCATETKYRKTLHSWEGTPEKEFVSAWGIPDGSYENDGKKYLVYKDSNVASFNGIAIDYQCKTVFTIEKGVMTDWSYEGNNCVSQ